MDSTYTPHSPNLTSVISSSSKAQQFNKPSISRQPYAPRSPTLSYSDINSLGKSNFQYASNSHAPDFLPNPNQNPNFDNSGPLLTSEGRQLPIFVPGPDIQDSRRFLSSSHRQPSAFAHTPTSDRSESHAISQDFYQNQGNININPGISSKNSALWAPTRRASTSYPTMSSSRGTKEKIERRASSNITSYSQYADPNPQKIEIKTKFPVARIKRIMQADEEVGKVAQVTPVAVSKALELFMIALVTGAAEKAREKGSKKVNAQHLKMVVDGQPERFDFLAEIVGKVGDNSEGVSGDSHKTNRKRKEESESASEEEKEKVKKKGRGRKKM